MATEQPMNSLLYFVPSVRCSLDLVEADRYVTWLGAFDHMSAKPLELYATFPPSVMAMVRSKQDWLLHRGRGKH
eukprot:8793965-Pyramimonas_sp.AAC.1